MPRSKSELSLLGQIAAHESWARTENRSARTAKARQALEDKFLTEAGGDLAVAASLRKAHYARMALKSAEARRRRAGMDSTAPPGKSVDSGMGGSTAPAGGAA